MTPTPSTRYRLDRDGRRFEVETASAGLSTTGSLFVDGAQVDEQKSKNQKIVLEGGGLTVVVRLNWLDQVAQILAVPQGTDPKRADTEGIAFDPPPGSRAAKMHKLKREHPHVYAARHVVLAVLQVLIGAIWIGALLSGLLPRIDLPAIPLPDLPAIPWPDLPDIPWPAIPLPDIDVPNLPFLAQLRELWSSLNWLVPIVIAVLVASNEVSKRRKREQAETGWRQGGVSNGDNREPIADSLEPQLMPHPLVDQLRFARSEFRRGIEGVSDEDARRRLLPMNCISWHLGHLAAQEQRYWLTFAQELTLRPALREAFRNGAPASTPPPAETWAAWREVTAAADPWLDTVTAETLASPVSHEEVWGEVTFGNLLLRTIYHYWFHTGENAAIRQQLGHTNLPDFVGGLDEEAPYRPE